MMILFFPIAYRGHEGLPRHIARDRMEKVIDFFGSK